MNTINTGFDVVQNIISGKWKSIILYQLGCIARYMQTRFPLE